MLFHPKKKGEERREVSPTTDKVSGNQGREMIISKKKGEEREKRKVPSLV